MNWQISAEALDQGYACDLLFCYLPQNKSTPSINMLLIDGEAMKLIISKTQTPPVLALYLAVSSSLLERYYKATSLTLQHNFHNKIHT